MEQDSNTQNGKIFCYQEVRLKESEFKNAHELDSSELKCIRDEYFKRTFTYTIIGIIVSAMLFVLWINGVIDMLYVFSDVITTVIMLLVAFIWAMSAYLIVRCIIALEVVSKINKQEFYWHVGHITRKRRLWIKHSLMWEHYYIVDDEYCSRRVFDPVYKKGTEVYFLYFPGFKKSSYMGGIVVKKKHNIAI